ncbi:MAG TPA: hypothetical protein VGB85_19450 [Nannocystis sp.]|jgi:hypothetical protein
MSDTHSLDAGADATPLLIVDFGKRQKPKQIRKLRKGTGKLTEKIQELVDELREQQTIAAGAQPVVIIVREKKKLMPRKLFGM